MQDPFNTQNFNRYGYGLNNPLKFTDPNGEEIVTAIIIGAIIGATSYSVSAFINNSWSWKDFGISVFGGALSGAIGGSAFGIASLTKDAVMNAVATGMVSAMIPSVNIPIGDWNFSISPAIAFGTGGSAFGVSAGISYSDGNWSFSANTSIRGKSGNSYSGGFSYLNHGRQSYSIGFTRFEGSASQNNWFVGYGSGDWSFKMTNDAFVGGDKYRTAAAEVGYKDYSFGFNLYTTAPPEKQYNRIINEEYDYREHMNYAYRSTIWDNEKRTNKYGAYSSGERVFAGMYLGIKAGNQVTRLGYDGAFVQDLFQNGIHRYVVRGPYFNTNLGSKSNIFSQYFTYNPWSLYAY